MFNIIPNGSARASMLVAIAGQSATSTGMRSGDDGRSWATVTFPAVVTWRNIGFGNRRFVGIGGSNNSMISTDGGQTFIAGGALPASLIWRHLAYSPARDRWLAAASNATNTVMATSDDGGVSWQSQTFLATGGDQNTSLTYLTELDRFVYGAAAQFRYSDDGGENWLTDGASNIGPQQVTSGAVTMVGGNETVCYVADRSAEGFALYGTSGISFTQSTTIGAAGGWGYICGGHEKFIATPAAGLNGNTIACSDDGGDTWVFNTIPYGGLFWTISPTQFGFVGLPSGPFGGQNLSMRSQDGLSWTVEDNAAASANWTKCATSFVEA